MIDTESAHNLTGKIKRDGFAVIENVIDEEAVNQLLTEFNNLKADPAFNQRAGKAFGIRNLLNVLPQARALANGVQLRALVEPLLGLEARVVRGIYFDKHRDANWKVAWHQDLTIAVRRQIEAEGYGPWSMKAGVPHVQPPVAVLENMLTLRLHLDDTDESNGALRVIPASHKYGRIGAQEEIQWRKEQRGVANCSVHKGGVMLMRPLLLHASSASANPSHRRVLHFEYSSADLPGGMEWYDA